MAAFVCDARLRRESGAGDKAVLPVPVPAAVTGATQPQLDTKPVTVAQSPMTPFARDGGTSIRQGIVHPISELGKDTPPAFSNKRERPISYQADDVAPASSSDMIERAERDARQIAEVAQFLTTLGGL